MKGLPLLRYHIFGLLCLLLSWAAQAEQKQRFDDYDVHYSVLNTRFLQPEVAARYGLTRGDEKALVNIAVRRDKGDSTEAVAATISGESSDLIHTTPLQFRQFKEQSAIYYLAEFDFMDQEIRRFTIRIQVDGESTPYTLKFTQRMYAEP